jgi:hypothetical protein
VEAEQPLTEEQRLKLMDLADDQVLIDTTEQQVYRSEDSATRVEFTKANPLDLFT